MYCHCRSTAGTLHNLARISVDVRRAVLSLQDVSDGNDVIGVGADDNGVHGRALRGDLSSTARSDHIDPTQGAQGALSLPSLITHHVSHRPINLNHIPINQLPNLCAAAQSTISGTPLIIYFELCKLKLYI